MQGEEATPTRRRTFTLVQGQEAGAADGVAGTARTAMLGGGGSIETSYVERFLVWQVWNDLIATDSCGSALCPCRGCDESCKPATCTLHRFMGGCL